MCTARMDAREEATEGKTGEWVRKGWAKIVNGYMKLSFGQKLLYAVPALGLSGASVIYGGALVIPAAIVMGGRRFLSGSGAAVGIEGWLENSAAKNRKEQAEKRVSTYLKQGEQITPESLKKLDQMLSQDISQSDRNFQKRKFKSFSRKATAALLGVVVGTSSLWLEKLHVMDAIKEWGGKGAKALAEVLPRPTISALPGETSSAPNSPEGLPASPDSPGPPSGTSEPFGVERQMPPSGTESAFVGPPEPEPDSSSETPAAESPAPSGQGTITPEAVPVNSPGNLTIPKDSSIERELIREMRAKGIDENKLGTLAHKAVHAFADIQKLPAESYNLVQPDTHITYHLDGDKLIIDDIHQPGGAAFTPPDTAQDVHERRGFMSPSIDGQDENILEGTEKKFAPLVTMRDFQIAVSRAGIELFGGYDSPGIKDPAKVRDFLGTPIYHITETNSGGRLNPEQHRRVVEFVKTTAKELGVGFNPERGESLAGYVHRIITVATERGKVGSFVKF